MNVWNDFSGTNRFLSISSSVVAIHRDGDERFNNNKKLSKFIGLKGLEMQMDSNKEGLLLEKMKRFNENGDFYIITSIFLIGTLVLIFSFCLIYLIYKP